MELSSRQKDNYRIVYATSKSEVLLCMWSNRHGSKSVNSSIHFLKAILHLRLQLYLTLSPKVEYKGVNPGGMGGGGDPPMF